MSKLKVSLAPGVSVEYVADDVFVMVPGSSDVIHLKGESANIVGRLSAGQVRDLPDSEVLSELIRLGVVTSSSISRRGLLTAGALGAGAGIAVMAMPTVAAASSPAGVGFSADNPILLNGTILQRGESKLYELQDSNRWGVDESVPLPSYPPDPFPTSGVTGVSDLELTAEWEVNPGPPTLGAAVPGGNEDDPYLGWTDSNFARTDDEIVIGTFTWDGSGDDNRTRYYRVTFRAGEDTEPEPI